MSPLATEDPSFSTGDLAGITASGNILIEAVTQDFTNPTATIMAKGSVGDLTAGGKIENP